MFATEPHTTAQFWALAIALSPAGAVLRYALSALNGRGPWGADFAWGTCAANLLGSVLSCLAALVALESDTAYALAAGSEGGGAAEVEAAIGSDNSTALLLIMHAVATGKPHNPARTTGLRNGCVTALGRRQACAARSPQSQRRRLPASISSQLHHPSWITPPGEK